MMIHATRPETEAGVLIAGVSAHRPIHGLSGSPGRLASGLRARSGIPKRPKSRVSRPDGWNLQKI